MDGIRGTFKDLNDTLKKPCQRETYHYLARSDALPLDPIELKLATQTYETIALKGVFGALRDAGPDYWGRRVIERHAGKPQLNELDYLIHSPDDRAGALGFGLNQEPPAPKRKFNQTLNLKKLQEIADALVSDEVFPAEAALEQVEELMLPSSFGVCALML